MENVLIFFDEPSFKSEIESLGYFIDRFNKVVKNYNSLGIGSLKSSEFMKLLFYPEKLLFDNFMSDKPTELMGSPVSKEKLFDLYDKPAGFNNLISEAKEISKLIDSRIKEAATTNSIYNNQTKEQIVGLFDFTDVDNIYIKESAVKETRSLYEVYAKSEKSKLFFGIAGKLCKLLNENKFFSSNDHFSNKNNLQKLMDCIDIKMFEEDRAQINIKLVKNI